MGKDDFSDFNEQFNEFEPMNEIDESDNGFDSAIEDAFSKDNKFESKTDNEVVTEKHEVRKKSRVLIIAGVVISIIAIVVVTQITKNAANTPSKDNTVNNKVNNQSVQAKSNEDNSINQVTVYDTDGWVKIDSEYEIKMAEQPIETLFTVTGIKNYVKVSNLNNDFMTKSVVTGTISGLIGTYEIEIPYSKASHLSIGNTFSVTIKVGEYKNKMVIDEIEY